MNMRSVALSEAAGPDVSAMCIGLAQAESAARPRAAVARRRRCITRNSGCDDGPATVWRQGCSSGYGPRDPEAGWGRRARFLVGRIDCSRKGAIVSARDLGRTMADIEVRGVDDPTPK